MNPLPSPSGGRRRRWRLLIGALLAVLAIGVMFWDWNWLKAPVERLVQMKTQREFHIDGDLDIVLGSPLIIRAERVRLVNAPWRVASAPDMFKAQALELGWHPLDFVLRSRWTVPSISATRPELDLATNDQGVGNWVFSNAGPGAFDLQIDHARIVQGRLSYTDRPRQTALTLGIDSSDDRSDPATLLVHGKGQWTKNPFTLNGAVAFDPESEDRPPLGVDLKAAFGETIIHAQGGIASLSSIPSSGLTVELSGEDLAQLYPLFGFAVPPSAPYRVKGRLSLKDDTWHYEGFKGKVGGSDLAGDAALEMGSRKKLTATLTSDLLDFKDLAGFVGGDPENNGKALAKDSDKVIPQTPYDLGKLRSMDADVRWKAKRIEASGLPLDNMSVHFDLKRGLLELSPLNFGVAGGTIASQIRMDASGKVIRTGADISARKISLRRLMPTSALANEAIGAIGGEIKLQGQGNSVADILGSSDGSVALGMGKGQVSNLLLEIAGIDIAESLEYLVVDKHVAVRCAFADFAVSDGIMTSRALAFDTDDTIIVGEGTVDLEQESLNLLLRPRPKDRSILSLRSPLVVQGSFKNPTFRPDMKRLGLRGAIAIALGSIAPPAALLATIEEGPGKDLDCGGQYAK